MYLKYIGENGSMGLVNGKFYDVKVFTKLNYILATWSPDIICSYESPQTLAMNWEKP